MTNESSTERCKYCGSTRQGEHIPERRPQPSTPVTGGDAPPRDPDPIQAALNMGAYLLEEESRKRKSTRAACLADAERLRQLAAARKTLAERLAELAERGADVGADVGTDAGARETASDLYQRLLAEKLKWFEEAAASDRQVHALTDNATLIECLGEIRHFAPSAMHWALNLAAARLAALDGATASEPTND